MISREDTLEGFPRRTFNTIKKNTAFYVLDDVAEKPELFAEESDDFSDSNNIEDLSGLHAKLIITENGSRVTVFTGSANTTSAAFSGKNVEFMVALSGRRTHVGINRFLGDENTRLSLINMLIPYDRGPDIPVENETRKELEKMLEQARGSLMDIKVLLTIDREPEGTFSLTISIPVSGFSLPDEVSGSCYPITIQEIHSKDLRKL